MNKIDRLKSEADKLGYRLQKKPDYQCSCYLPYPNEYHKHKNGTWKCIDKYEPIEHKTQRYGSLTHCRKKVNHDHD